MENYPPSQRKRSVFCQFMSLINVLNLCPFTSVKERVEVYIWDGKCKRKIPPSRAAGNYIDLTAILNLLSYLVLIIIVFNIKRF